jgi:hypothetical protein
MLEFQTANREHVVQGIDSKKIPYSGEDERGIRFKFKSMCKLVRGGPKWAGVVAFRRE